MKAAILVFCGIVGLIFRSRLALSFYLDVLFVVACAVSIGYGIYSI